MSKQTRRAFLGQTAAGMAAVPFTIVPSQVLGAKAGKKAPSDKLNIAGIGVGGMGAVNLGALYEENVVALCDVDHEYAAKTFKKYAQAKVYKDYRVMLEQQKDIDAVVIATPDHTHAVISMAAMAAGKHVYCQKPLTHDIYEARLLAEGAKQYGVTTVMGIQGHSSDAQRKIVEWIEAGIIGKVAKVDTWCSLSYYPFGHASWSTPVADRPKETPAVPEGLPWDLWIGPAPMRPYHSCYHPRVWRAWWDFGCGMMGDRGAHTIDVVKRALKLGHPTSIDASSTGGNEETHPLAAVVRYEFPQRGALPALTMNWYEGLRPPRPAQLPDDEVMGHPEGGMVFYGEKGIITAGVYGGRPRLYPVELNEAADQVPERIPRVKGSHEQDWAQACKAGEQPGASFEYSGPLTEIALLGNVAKRMDSRILWDGDNLRVTNNEKANEWVKRPYREGWEL